MRAGEARGLPTVILITDPRVPRARVVEVIERAATGMDPRALLVQLRDKAADETTLVDDARALRVATSRVGAAFVMNAFSSAFLRVAHEAGADGVHVPSNLVAEARAIFGREAFVSMPAHTDDEVGFGGRAGATAVLVSPIWETPGKGPAIGIAALEAARAIASGSVAVYALGGVDESRAAACAGAGADGVAVIRALLDAQDPAAAARLLDAPFQRAGRRLHG